MRDLKRSTDVAALVGAGFSVTPEMFANGANLHDGETSATAAIQAAHDWCWNDGNIRGQVQLIASATPYLITDHDEDGKGLVWKPGVNLAGAGRATVLEAGTSGMKVLYVERASSGWKKGHLRNFWIDGADIADTAIEFYGDAYALIESVTAIQADCGFVVDGSQNHVFTACVAQHCRIGWSLLNGAGSVELNGCSSDAAEELHILVDNDESRPGYLLGHPEGDDPVLAYANPRQILVQGGVYERARSGSTLKSVLRVNTASDLNFSDVVFGGTSDCETVVDMGRHNLAAVYVSASSFRISSVDCADYFVTGRRVKITGASGSVYGEISTSEFTGGNTYVTLTMDSGQSVPNEALTASLGRADDDGDWFSDLAGGLLNHCQVYAATGTMPAIRSGSADAGFEKLTFLACGGDWVETSRPMFMERCRGNLAAEKQRTRHIKGESTAAAEISYVPLRPE